MEMYSLLINPGSFPKLANAGLPSNNLQPEILVVPISTLSDRFFLPQRKELHVYCWRHGFESNDKVKTSLVDMYANNGSINVARSLFEMLEGKRIVSWKNAMLTGCAMHGHANEALDSFEQLNGKALPDLITFVGVLVACTAVGLLDEWKKYFRSMVSRQLISLYACMIDLLGHCGHLEEVYNHIMEMIRARCWHLRSVASLVQNTWQCGDG
ncbi:putative pentatricopeptide repeat-containing protein At3g23330 [Cucurbita maxima]|uniref:Pentatricopeptide repeat-containing protein At3g23330 n=1 Tax=Cucurbita maxima TaxID=3661 RepID=A0A6J1JVL2_CUCMA|nr:putative pentatricopeptide repeat-containing protein At3g23330 [Cucurbita maxima]